MFILEYLTIAYHNKKKEKLNFDDLLLELF
jgi:hypothetical protein